MKIYRVTCAVLCLFLCAGLLSGYRKLPDTKYFSVYWETQFVTVSEKSLRANWYHAESRNRFAKGKSVYERANEISASESSEKQLKEKFPEFYQVVSKLERSINVEPFDGTIQFAPDGYRKFCVSGAREGRSLDTERLCADILGTLQKRKYADIPASIKIVQPRDEDVVLSKIALKSTYTTSFDRRNEDRTNNIALALLSFNGKTVRPGEEVSFNTTVGPRTAARGYEEANIIIDGEFVMGIGGGVCQASTTVFNAALLAGLQIVESHNHSLQISYVPLGRDAMVSSGADLVFKNDSGSPIYIEANASAATGKATVNIYGTKVESLTYKPRVESKTLPIEEEVEGKVPADLLKTPSAYKKIIVEQGAPARESMTYLEIYKNGHLVNSKLIRKSRYKGKKTIIKYEKIPLDIPEDSVI